MGYCKVVVQKDNKTPITLPIMHKLQSYHLDVLLIFPGTTNPPDGK